MFEEAEDASKEEAPAKEDAQKPEVSGTADAEKKGEAKETPKEGE